MTIAHAPIARARQWLRRLSDFVTADFKTSLPINEFSLSQPIQNISLTLKEKTMNLESLIAQLAGQQFLVPFVHLARLSQPTASDAELEALVLGNLKHYLRHYIGFLVDFVFADSQITVPLTDAIAAAVTATPVLPMPGLTIPAPTAETIGGQPQ